MAQMQMVNLADIYRGAEAVKGARTQNKLADLALQNEPQRIQNQNRLAELTIQSREQGNQIGTVELTAAEQAQAAQEAQLFLNTLGSDYAELDPQQQSQRWMAARQQQIQMDPADEQHIPQQFDPNFLQQIQGMAQQAGAGKNTGVQSTFTTQDGKLGYVTRDGRTVVTDQNVQRSYQARDYGGMPYIFDNKSGALIPVGGGAEDDIREDIDKNRQEELTLEQQLEQARAYAKAEAEKQITQEGQMGTLNDALSVYNRLKSSDLGLIYGKGEKWVPEFMRSQRGIDLMADRDQLLGMLSLAGRGQLKGQGEITENEQKTLTEAQTVLGNPNISPEAAKRALHDAMNILRRMAGQPELERPPEEGGDSGASSGKSVKWGDL